MKRNNKVLICTIIAFLAAARSAYASAISFQIVQHDSSQDKIRNSTYEIEEALMDYFFDAGFIVTNSPTVMSTSPDDDVAAYKKSMNDALDGDCDVFVNVIAEYDIDKSSAPELDLLSNIKEIRWEIYNVITGEMISSGKKSIGVVDPADDTEKGIADFASQIAVLINSGIKSK